MRPTVFVASSSESKCIALAIQENLEHDADLTVWTQDVFGPTEYTLESLLNRLEKSEFGIFVLTADDLANVRGAQIRVPRDNVLFELGLFIGRLGREHCFMLVAQGEAPLHLPNNLDGVSVVQFVLDRENPLSSLGPACNRIRRAIGERKRGLPPSAIVVIEQILQASARLIALRSGLSANEVRGFCHIFEDSNNCLRPMAKYTGLRVYDDANIDIPWKRLHRDSMDDWYVISRALYKNCYLCEEVNWGADLDNIPFGREIWGDLNSVVAHPLRPLERGVLPIGTIAFDSSKRLSEVRWKEDRDLQDILALLATTIYAVIRRMR
jgi:hypothetical protein